MKLLAAIATLAAGIGAFFWSKRDKGGIQADSKFRGQLKRAIAEVGRVAPMKFKNNNITLTTPKAEKVENGLPVFWVKSEQRFVGGHWTGGGRIAVALHNGEIHNGALLHELWHVLLGQHGVPVAEHHALMRKHGVYGA